MIIGGYAAAGGLERIFLEEVSYFLKNGFETHALALNEVPPLQDIFDGAYKVEIEVIPKRFRSKRFLPRNVDRFLRVLALRKRINQIKPRVIIAPGSVTCSALYLATLFTRFPYVTHIHQTIFWPETSGITFERYAIIHRKVFNEIRESVPTRKEFLPLSPKLGLRLRVLLELGAIADYIAVRKAKRIFVFSDQMKWEVKKLYGKDAVVLKGAFDRQVFNYKPKQDIKQKLGFANKRVIFNLNNLIPKKRVALLIKAFEQISKKFEDVALVIGGEGPEEERLRNMVDELKVGNKVKFMGYIPEGELWDYYSACDVFVHLDCGDFDLSAYAPLALQKKVVWSCEMEVDQRLAQNRHIFIARPIKEDVVRVIEEALTTEVPKKNDLSDYTWDAYFGNLTTEILPIIKGGKAEH